MENNQKPEIEQSSPKLSARIDTNVKIVIAFFLGAILAGTLVQFALPLLAKHASELMIGFIAVIGLLAIIALIFTIFKEFFFKLFFGISKADLADVKKSADDMAVNAVKRDWEAASQDFKVISQKGSAWYAWLSYRRWVVTVFYTLFLAFAGLLGSVLLYNQNQLLEKQNEKIDAQNLKIDSQIQLEESSRRGNLIVMMSNIMDKVDEELTRDWNSDSIRNLSPQLIGRIAALSQSFRPYRFWQDSMLIKKPLSPERGQLLLALVNSNLDSLTYNNIYEKTTFKQAYLENVNLRNAYLKEADLSYADIKYTDLRYADLRSANLKYANLREAILRYADLRSANLKYANLREAILRFANLKSADLSYANLNEAVLRFANLKSADLRYGNLKKVDLIEADLRYATLWEADLSFANLENANLNNVYLKETILRSANLKSTNLRNTDLRFVDLRYADLSFAHLMETKVDKRDWIEELKQLQVIGIENIKQRRRVDTIRHTDILGDYYLLIFKS